MFKTVNRDNTNAIKWERYRPQGLLPMWVADMDIASPNAVRQALIDRLSHPVYGYTHPWASLNHAVVNWCQKQYQWAIEPDWVVWMPGVVPSFNLAVDIFGQKGRVLVQTPNYPPLLAASERQGCQTVNIPIHWQENTWLWDWTQLEAEMAHPDCHLMLLCNPMNPQGSMVSEKDLTQLASLALKYNVFICSDEIHCDLILDNVSHTPASSLDALKHNSVTLMAASKTFNVAGLGCSFAIIPDAKIRNRWQTRMTDLVPHPNFLGMIAAEVAFTQCDAWHQSLKSHLRQNRDYLAKALNQLDGLIFRPQPATFLAWIESTRENLSLDEHFINAGIMPSEGKFFGNHQAVRLNFGTGSDTVEQAISLLNDYWHQTKP